MAGTFKFELVSPEKILISEDAEQVIVPGSEGEFTVLVGHAPFISTLRPGVLDVTLPSGKRRIFIKGGFAEVEPDRLTLLAQKALDADQPDVAVVSAELKIAETELAEAKDDHARFAAQSAIDWLRTMQKAA